MSGEGDFEGLLEETLVPLTKGSCEEAVEYDYIEYLDEGMGSENLDQLSFHEEEVYEIEGEDLMDGLGDLPETDSTTEPCSR